MPPPSDVAWFLVILQEETISVPWLEMPPPSAAELPLTVQLVSVLVAVVRVAVEQAAAADRGGVAADGAVGQRGRAVGCPTPPPTLAEFPLTVQLVSVAWRGLQKMPPPLRWRSFR